MSRRIGAGCAAIGLLAALAGCGERVLWDRWLAERALWHADRESARLGAGSAASVALESAYARIVSDYPAREWAPRARQPGRARDVAAAAARAQWRLASLALERGEPAVAALRAERTAADWSSVPLFAAPALDLLAEAHVRLGDEAGAQAALERLVATAPLVSDEGLGILRVTAEAPFALARIARARGDEPAAQSALLRIEARAIEAERHAGPGTRAGLEALREQLRAARGDSRGALALGHSLALGLEEPARRERMLALALAALELGQPDSALEYARAAEPAPSRRVGGAALLAAARAQLAMDAPDSALASLERLSERWHDLGTLTPEARFLRGEALAKAGREETARAERRSLLASFPAHPLGFLALDRIVAHHAARGERELARIEGEQALAILARTLESHRDPAVQRDALLARAAILEHLGRGPEADSTAFELFARFPGDSASQVAFLRSLERWPAAAAGQAALWRTRIASRSMSPEVRAWVRRHDRGGAP